jgi:hypothetical protein
VIDGTLSLPAVVGETINPEKSLLKLQRHAHTKDVE